MGQIVILHCKKFFCPQRPPGSANHAKLLRLVDECGQSLKEINAEDQERFSKYGVSS